MRFKPHLDKKRQAFSVFWRHIRLVQILVSEPSAPVRCDNPIKSEEPTCSYLTKLRYETRASISFGPNLVATRGIGDAGSEWLCLSEIKFAHTDGEVRQEMA